MKRQFLNGFQWHNAVYLFLSAIVALTLTPVYLYREGFQWQAWVLFVFFVTATNIAITAGYHRYFAHRSHQAGGFMRLIYLIVGASAFQGSVLKWATDHRRHHRHVDTQDDPYNIRQGFFHAHLGWLVMPDNPKFEGKFPSDLATDKWVVFQDRYYVFFAILLGVLVPTLIGAAMGSWLLGFAVFAALRLFVTNHGTFFINSLCHFVGRQPYTDQVSARDSHIMALLACGEGYHNYHHMFQSDYRNGVRWYQWDPTKWFLSTMSLPGFVRGLKRTPQSAILRARLEMDQKRLLLAGVSAERLYPFRKKLEEAQYKMRQLKADYYVLKSDVKNRSTMRIRQMKDDIRTAKRDFKRAWRDWLIVRKRPSLVMA